jgi:hypothetical protein
LEIRKPEFDMSHSIKYFSISLTVAIITLLAGFSQPQPEHFDGNMRGYRY